MKLEKLQKITEKHKQLVLEIIKKHPKPSSIENIIKMLKDEKKLNHEYARQRITINAAAESQFNKKMLQYMLWYNTERPHHSLNKKSPNAYFCDII